MIVSSWSLAPTPIRSNVLPFPPVNDELIEPPLELAEVGMRPAALKFLNVTESSEAGYSSVVNHLASAA